MTTLAALVPDGGVERGLAALFTEADRVVRFGFTATELAREKLDSQRYLDEALLEKDKSPSGPLADELVRHVVQDEPVPGIVYEQAMSQRFLPDITLAEVNALAADGSAIAIASSPSPRLKGRPALPTRRPARRGDASATTAPLTAYVDRVQRAAADGQPCRRPAPIARATTREALGITEWQLSNGVRVVLKPTTVQGGRNLVPRAQPRRHVDRERPGFHRRPRPPSRSSPQAASGSSRSIDLTRCWPA